jgi:hypothetical protein
MSDIHAVGHHAFSAAFVRPEIPQMRTAKPRGELHLKGSRTDSGCSSLRRNWSRSCAHRRRAGTSIAHRLQAAAASIANNGAGRIKANPLDG